MLFRSLPPGAANHQAVLEAPEGATAFDVMDQLGVPREACHLVLVNGVFLEPGKRGTDPLSEGNALAMWPPVAGG